MPFTDKCNRRPVSGPGRPDLEKETPLFRVEDLCLSFGPKNRTREVLSKVSFAVRPGELAALIGPSGCGKSTLFNLLAGLLAPTSGRIFLEETPVPHLRGSLAYMQQKDLLLPWRNVLDNAVLGLEIAGLPKSRAREQARKLLPVFGLTGFEGHRPDQLSGGMRQRVALMRTILCRKRILLLDEPFGALDAITRRTVQNWFLGVWERFRPTVVLVTHDVEEALMLADRIQVMSGQPSAFIKETIPVSLERPRRAAAREMILLRESLLKTLEQG